MANSPGQWSDGATGDECSYSLASGGDGNPGAAGLLVPHQLGHVSFLR